MRQDELLRYRAYRLFPTQWNPEANIVIVDLDQIKELEESGLALFLLLFHELLHIFSGSNIGKYNGIILNLAGFSSQSVTDIIRCWKDESGIAQTKENIIKREVAADNLFLSSRDLIEALNAYQTKRVFIPLVDRYSKVIRIILKQQFEDELTKWREKTKLLIMQLSREKNIPKQLVEKKWKGYIQKRTEEYLQKIISSFVSTIETFANSILTGYPAAQRIFDELIELERITGSVEFSIYIGNMALDIPYCPEPDKLLSAIPLQYNPLKRFDVLMNALKELNKVLPIKRNRILRNWIKQQSFENLMKLDSFLKKETGLTTYDYLCLETPKVISFDIDLPPLQKKLGSRETRIKTVHSFKDSFNDGLRIASEANPKNLEDVLDFFLQRGLSPPILVVTRKETLIKLGQMHEFSTSIPGLCMEILKNQIYRKEVIHPARYVAIKDQRLLNDLDLAVELIKKFQSTHIAEWLLERFKQTSELIGRKI